MSHCAKVSTRVDAEVVVVSFLQFLDLIAEIPLLIQHNSKNLMRQLQLLEKVLKIASVNNDD
jgi:hypothetical protein